MKWVAIFLLLQPGIAGASCYRLLDTRGQSLYEGIAPPFDISYPGNSGAYEASRSRGEILLIDNGPCGADPVTTARVNPSPYQYGAGTGESNGTGSSQDYPFYGYGHDIQVGPRGGHYYVNSKGKKVYVDH